MTFKNGLLKNSRMSSIKAYTSYVTYKQSFELIWSIFHCHRCFKSQVSEPRSIQVAVVCNVAPFLLLLLLSSLTLPA